MSISPPEDVVAFIRQTLDEHQADPNRTFATILSALLSYYARLAGQYVADITGAQVQTGPFAGMRYVHGATLDVLGPKLLGCYELELHSVIAQLPARGYRRIINLGCAEGYYAVGLARLLPQASVFAFDTNEMAQESCRRVAEINGVADRVIVAGECRPANLQAHLAPDTFVLCDVEGAERELLDPAQVPGLSQCDILVELHDFIDPGLSALVCSRLAESHHVQLIPHCARDPFAFPFLAKFGEFYRFVALWEGRPGPTPWAFLTRH